MSEENNIPKQEVVEKVEENVVEKIEEKAEQKVEQKVEEKQPEQIVSDEQQQQVQKTDNEQNAENAKPQIEQIEQIVKDEKAENAEKQDSEQTQTIGEQSTQESNSTNLQNLFLKANYEFPIEIKVSDPVEKKGGMSSYVVYTIKGKDCFGEFEIQRRFNEFYTIRDLLLAKWPGQYVPPIPEKSVSTGAEIVAERTRLLNIFCMKMIQIKHLYYSEEFQDIFLRSTNADITKQLASVPKQNVSQFIERYKQTFNISEIKEISAEMISKMGGVQAFLRKSQTGLGKMLEQAKSLSSSRKSLKEQFFQIFGLGVLDYEKITFQDCVQASKLVFANPLNSDILELVKKIKDPIYNSLDKIQDLISTEQRDIDAFLQAFQTRDSIMAAKQKVEQKLSEEQSDLYKIMKGNSTMKGAFSKLSLDEQKQKLELQLNETQKEVDLYKLLFQLVTDVLVSYSIEKFKSDKHNTYKSILKDLAQCELQYLNVQQQFWLKVQDFIKANQEE